MANLPLQKRVADLEQEVEALKKELRGGAPTANQWVDEIFGAFRDDPTFKRAMRLGREASTAVDKPKRPVTDRNGHS